jgi:hypothetical protein
VKKNRDKYSPLLGFVDLLLNLAVSFTFLFMLSQLLVNPNKAQTTSSEREGTYIIEARWDDGADADVDLWVKAPNDERSGFFSRDVQTMSLLRDDLGNSNDWYTNEKGQAVLNPINREEVTIRTPIAGNYIVNIHYFRKGVDGIPDKGVTVTVTLKRIKENIVISERKLIVKERGEEFTAFVFNLNDQKEVTKVEQPARPIPWVVGSGSNTMGLY